MSSTPVVPGSSVALKYYCGSVQGPGQGTESGQMAAITGRWQPSHSQQLEELSLEPLDTRRTRLCQRFAVWTATKSRHTDIFSPAAKTGQTGAQSEGCLGGRSVGQRLDRFPTAFAEFRRNSEAGLGTL